MALPRLEVAPHALGLWRLTATGRELTSVGTKDELIQLATENLTGRGGGVLVVYTPDGFEESITQIAASGAARRPDGTREDEQWHPGEAGAAAAQLADQVLGRTEPKSAFAPVEGVAVNKLVPAAVAASPQFKVVQQGVTAGSLGVALAALLFGSGTFSAVSAAASSAATGSATVGSYTMFIQAFVLTLALSVSVAVFAYMALGGMMQTLMALGLWVVVAVVITLGIGRLGLDSLTWNEIYAGLNTGSHPAMKAMGLLGAFAQHYGFLPFLGGVITGSCTGWMMHRIAPPQP